MRAARLNRGLSRRELADLAGISVPYVTKIENGDRRPQAPVVARLADALAVSPAMLLHTPEVDESRVWRRAAQGAPRGGAREALHAPLHDAMASRPEESGSGPESVAGPARQVVPDRAALLAHAMRLVADADAESLRAVVAMLESRIDSSP